MTELTIPSGVIDIGEWAFQGCSALTRVSIPASVASIEKVAFYKTGLKDVYYAGTRVQGVLALKLPPLIRPCSWAQMAGLAYQSPVCTRGQIVTFLYQALG